MDPAFRLPEGVEDLRCLAFDRLRQGTGGDQIQLAARRQAILAAGIIQSHRQLDAADFAAGIGCGGKLIAADVQPGQFRLQRSQGQAQIQQCPQKHIAAGPANGLNVGRFHP